MAKRTKNWGTIKQSDLDKLPSAVLFDDEANEEMENLEHERLKVSMYGETGFGALRNNFLTEEEINLRERCKPNDIEQDEDEIPF